MYLQCIPAKFVPRFVLRFKIGAGAILSEILYTMQKDKFGYKKKATQDIVSLYFFIWLGVEECKKWGYFFKKPKDFLKSGE